MYKTKAYRNILTSVLYKVLILIVGLITRRYMVNILGDEITGIYSLFISILGFLAVAELGIGSAIVFSMYKPISDGDIDKVSALYHLYKKIYLIIFLVINLVGLIITPFLPVLASGFTIGKEIYFTYILFLVSTSISYLYAYKSSFINAHMDNHITNSIRSIFQIVELVVQVFIIIWLESFIIFLAVHLISNISQWIATNYIFSKRYKHLTNNNKELSPLLTKEVKDKTKAMFYHKVGGLLVNTMDSLIISAFIGVNVLGKYSNYVLIITSMIGILSLVFTSIVTVLGHAFAKFTKNILNTQFKKIYLVNFLMGMIFFLGFFSVSEELIKILFNDKVVLESELVIIMTLNYFIQFMRLTVLSFKDASGTFYQDRYKPIVEGVTNLFLSLLFVYFWGLPGVLIATIITNLMIAHTIEPFVLYKYGFEMNPKKYYIHHYLGMLLFSVLIVLFKLIPFPNYNNLYLLLIIKGLTSILVSAVVMLILYITIVDFRTNANSLYKEMMQKFKNDKT